MELSIIIPVYNALPYLVDCMESIASQGLDKSRYEVILVDDGSTDGSGAACDEAAAKYPNFRVLHEKNSGGASRPRNIGIENARGDYLFFSDADDALCPDALEKMLAHAKELGSDMCCFKILSDWGSTYNGLFDHPRQNCNIDDDPLLDFFGVYKLYSRELVAEGGIRFIENLFPEDWPFSMECYLNAKNVCVVCDQDYYHYRKRDDGVSLTRNNLSVEAGRWQQKTRALKAFLDVAERYLDIDQHPKIALRASRWISGMAHLDDGTFASQDSIDTFSGLLRPHYTQAVRSMLPFSVLLTCDAMIGGCSVEQLDKLVKSIKDTDTISFGTDESGRHTYAMSTRSGEKIVSGVMPERPTADLAAPKLKAVRVTKTSHGTDSLTVAGRSFALFPEGARGWQGCSLCARLAGGEKTIAIPTATLGEDVSEAYAGVLCRTAEWESTLTWDDLSPLRPEDGDRVDLYLGFQTQDGGHDLRRIGANRVGGSLDDATRCLVSAGEHVLSPIQTGFGNLSVTVRPSRERLSAARDFRLTEMAWKKHVLQLGGSFSVLPDGALGAKVLFSAHGSEDELFVSAPAKLSFSGNRAHFETYIDTEGLVTRTLDAWGVPRPKGLGALIGRRDGRLAPHDVPDIRWDLYLELSSEGGVRRVRIGAKRPKGSLDLFKDGGYVLGAVELAGEETGYKNLSIRARRA